MFMLRLFAGALSVRWRAVCPARRARAQRPRRRLQEGCNRDRSLGAARGSIVARASRTACSVPLTAYAAVLGWE